MFSFAYAKTLAERAITVFASSLAGLLSADGVGLVDAPWGDALSVAGMAALVAVLLSVAGGSITTSRTPAWTSRETEQRISGQRDE